MSTTREKAITTIAGRSTDRKFEIPSVEAVAENYASDVFNIEQMRQVLNPQVLRKLLKTVKNREPLDPSIADEVANAMKQWAVSKGASHYTHWFQPLNGTFLQ